MLKWNPNYKSPLSFAKSSDGTKNHNRINAKNSLVD